MELALYDLGGSSFIQTSKDAKIRQFMIEKICSGKKVSSVIGQSFVEEVRHDPFNHLSRSQE